MIKYQNEKFEIGQSGDQISPTKIDDKLVVRKTFSGKDKRALNNIRKQVEFPQSGFLNIRPCRIISHSEYSCEMEYVFGHVGPDISAKMHVDAYRNFTRNLDQFLTSLLDKSKEVELESSIIHEKCADILSRSHESFHADLSGVFRIISSLLNGSNSIRCPVGNCHGDLTFSNMIVSDNGEICLIDFLQTFFESPLQDISKVVQELKYGWSHRYCKKYQQTIGQISNAWTFNELKIIRTAYDEYPIVMPVLELLTLARIAPYCKDEVTTAWLKNSLRKAKDEYYGLVAAHSWEV